MASHGIGLDQRHVMLLADLMTYRFVRIHVYWLDFFYKHILNDLLIHFLAYFLREKEFKKDSKKLSRSTKLTLRFFSYIQEMEFLKSFGVFYTID